MVPLDELKEQHSGSRVRRNLVVAALVLFFVIPGLVFVLQPSSPPDEQVRLPDFELPLLQGGGTLSSDDLDGNPVVLNFFASWCLPCREEAPLLEDTYQEYRARGVRFVGVNLQDTETAGREFVEEFGITYPVVKDYDKVLAEDLGVTIGLPQTFFVDSSGLVSSQRSGEQVGSGQGGTASLGAIDRAELIDQIEALLEEQ